MLTWSDIRAIDSISDPLGVVSVFVDRPDHAAGRLVRAVALAGELRRLEGEVNDEPLVAAYRECLPHIRPALRSPSRSSHHISRRPRRHDIRPRQGDAARPPMYDSILSPTYTTY